MNFLSHFYFDKQVKDPLVVLGIVLPDLYKPATGGMKLHPERYLEEIKKDPQQISLLKGWRKHHIVDDFFHGSEFFTKHTKDIRIHLEDVVFDKKVKRFAIAHVMLELIIDGLLIKNNQVSVDDFYARLLAADKVALEKFFQLNGIKDTKKFFGFFEHFLKVQYAYDYQYNESIVFALSRIFGHFWNMDFAPYKKELSKTVNHFSEKLENSYLTIYNEIEQQL
jgi:hypothetical protein